MKVRLEHVHNSTVDCIRVRCGCSWIDLIDAWLARRERRGRGPEPVQQDMQTHLERGRADRSVIGLAKYSVLRVDRTSLDRALLAGRSLRRRVLRVLVITATWLRLRPPRATSVLNSSSPMTPLYLNSSVRAPVRCGSAPSLTLPNRAQRSRSSAYATIYRANLRHPHALRQPCQLRVVRHRRRFTSPRRKR